MMQRATFYKPEGQDGTGADLVYDGDDISSYTGLNLKTNEEYL